MNRNISFKYLFATSLLTLLFCSPQQPEEADSGTISGKILYPDSNLLIRILPSDGNVDTATLDPVSKMFVFNNVQYGKCILQIRADGYGFHEQKFELNKPQLVLNDIALAHTPSNIAYLFPSNSQNVDSLFFSVQHTAITDTGFQVVITFNSRMDSNSVYNALTISPDTVGVKTELVLGQSLVVFFPYWKLEKTDTVKISVGSGAIDVYDDTLDFDYNVFFPVDSIFIQNPKSREMIIPYPPL